MSVAYVPNEAGTGAKLAMRVDGGDAQTKDITGLAYLNSNIKGKVGFGNDVHSAALSRGFVGSLSEIRPVQNLRELHHQRIQAGLLSGQLRHVGHQGGEYLRREARRVRGRA